MVPDRHDENLYESPRAVVNFTAIDDRVDTDYRSTSRGKRAIITIICVLIGVSTVTIFLSVAAGMLSIFVQVVALAILIAQCVLLYRGLLWARVWLLLSLIVACLLAVILVISMIADGNVLGTAIATLYGLLDGGIALTLLLSGSIREFLNAQLNSSDKDR